MNPAPRNAHIEIVARKKNWAVTTPDRRPFPMILMDEAMDHERALAHARCIWPACTVE
jgi:hypothetical protein